MMHEAPATPRRKSEASELRVLAPADASDDRPLTEPFGTAPPGRFDQFAFREAVPESVGAMRSSSADCVEKSELRARSVLALERLAEGNE